MINRLMREKKLLEAQLRDANNLADQWAQMNIALEAECERLRQFQIAYNDWQAKTDWVQESAKPNELGRHRADVLRARIEALAAELAAINRREPVCEVSEETFSSDGTSDIITCNLPIGTKLYTLPAAPEGGEV